MTKPFRKKLILNVDDDEAGRYAVTRVLKLANFEVVEAGSGAEGLKLAAEHSPDLVLLDVHLPDIDGFEVCRLLKQKHETTSIPVVHMSASYLDSKHQAKGLEGGADAYLVEPVDPLVLVASVNSMLRIREAEREVRNYANAWQSTFDSLQEGIAILESGATILQANQSFKKIFADEADGLTGPAPEKTLAELVAEVEASGQQVKWETARGSSSLAISLDPIHTTSGNRGVICFVRDVTERNKLEENLRFTQKLEGLGLMAGGIAHDFNNLLTGILGNASLALDTEGLPTVVRPMLEEVVLSSERAAALTRQLLAYAGKGRFFIHSIDLSKMLRETLQLLRTSLVPIELKLNLDDALPSIQADKTQIQQLLMNLVVNAIEALEPKGGRLSISTRAKTLDAVQGAISFPNYVLKPGRYVSVEVEDSGIGMDAATLDRIFDPFFSTKFVGRGLGLAAALGIVQGHQGAIRVASTQGQGTYFEIVFPAAEGVATEDRTAAPKAAKKPAVILMIEDEDAVSKMMKYALEIDGHSIVVARDGAEGVGVFQSSGRKFDLVMVDLTMPLLGGEETIRRIQALDPKVRIVVCTGHSEAEAPQIAQWGIRGVIAKPFGGSQLRNEVRKYLNDN